MGSVRARRHFTSLRKAACWALVLVACGPAAAAQSSEARLVIDTDVVCRADPRRDATVVWGDQFQNISRVTVDGEEWYRWSRGSCWTYGPLTVTGAICVTVWSIRLSRDEESW